MKTKNQFLVAWPIWLADRGRKIWAQSKASSCPQLQLHLGLLLSLSLSLSLCVCVHAHAGFIGKDDFEHLAMSAWSATCRCLPV